MASIAMKATVPNKSIIFFRMFIILNLGFKNQLREKKRYGFKKTKFIVFSFSIWL